MYKKRKKDKNEHIGTIKSIFIRKKGDYCKISFKDVDEENTISIKDVRETLYSRYEAELKNLWEHSVFAWGFELLLFTGYGYLIANFFLKSEKCINYGACYFVAIILGFVGLCTSAIWIALAKASKTWQEVFESQIVELEGNSEYFKNPRNFAMGGFHNRLNDLDSSLRSQNIGKFSPGKLNIFIAQFTWCIWCFTIGVHFLICNYFFIRLLVIALGFAYVGFLNTLKTKCANKYFEKEEYSTEYTYEMYLKLEELQKKFNEQKPKDIEFIKTFITEDLPHLNCIWNKDFFDDDLKELYMNLAKDFKYDYVKNKDRDSLINKYQDEIAFVLKCYEQEIWGKM